MTDPVASRSGFLCTYMSNHPDTLVAYVRHFGKVTAPVVSASMTSIDTNGMTLSYLAKGTDVKKQTTVRFQPPLSGYDEVKPRLLGMKLDAEEALGMTRRAQISTFEIPSDALILLSLMILLTYVTFSVPNGSSSLYNLGPRIRSSVGGSGTLRIIWALAGFVHLLETVYMITLCKRHVTGPRVAAQYVMSTLIVGFPMIRRLRKLVQKARIDSIDKVH